ncbi:MAG: GNAT family N-acetyltransferase [Saprospiraceae bacterium]
MISIFETERLILRPTDQQDASFIYALVNTPKWLKNIGDRNVHSENDAAIYIQQKMTLQYEKLGFGNFTVIRKKDNVKLGTCGLYDRQGIDGVDIGFAFLPEFENQGYGFESASEVMFRAKNDFGLNCLYAITLEENISSQKLIEKLGFYREGLITLPPSEEKLMLYKKVL